MDRRKLIISGAAAAGTALIAPKAFAQSDPYRPEDDRPAEGYQDGGDYRDRESGQGGYSREEVVRAGSDFLGVTAEAVAAAVERIARDNGSEPTAYIAGEEGSGAFVAGLRYGKGLLYLPGQEPTEVYWRGPSIGWDWGGNASRVFTLCYNLRRPEMIFRRYPGVEGSAYLVGGLGVNYQKADDITLAPIRAGVCLRLGANVGYLAYSRNRKIFPF